MTWWLIKVLFKILKQVGSEYFNMSKAICTQFARCCVLLRFGNNDIFLYLYISVFFIGAIMWFKLVCDSETIHKNFTMEPCIVWEYLSLPIGEPDCRNIIIEKPCVEGAQHTGNMQIYSITIATGIPGLDGHISFIDWKYIVQITYWAYRAYTIKV